MKFSPKLSIALTFAAITGLSFTQPNEVEASKRFFCGTYNGEPATLIQTPQGTKPLIQYRTTSFGYTWSPSKRCREVTRKLNKVYQNNEDFLTVCRKRGYNIICSSKTANSVCQRQIITVSDSKNVATYPVAIHSTFANSIKQESSLLFLMLGMTTTVGLGLLKHTIPETHDPKTGLIDGILFADILGLSHEEMAKLLDRTVAGLRKNPTSDKLQPTLLKLYVLTIKLRGLSDDSIEKVRIYLHSPHPDLNYQTPLSYLLDGKFEEIEAIINCLEKQKIVA
ncbi:MAG: COP23 domain-containing protein [Microcystaceae cyanobacterium]